MVKKFTAIYEKGILRPTEKISLPEHQKMQVTVSDLEDIPSEGLLKAAEQGSGFEFLNQAGEDIYSLKDGEAV